MSGIILQTTLGFTSSLGLHLPTWPSWLALFPGHSGLWDLHSFLCYFSWQLWTMDIFDSLILEIAPGIWVFDITGIWHIAELAWFLIGRNVFPKYLIGKHPNCFLLYFISVENSAALLLGSKWLEWHLAQIPSGCCSLPFPGLHLRWKTAAWQGACCSMTNLWHSKVGRIMPMGASQGYLNSFRICEYFISFLHCPFNVKCLFCWIELTPHEEEVLSLRFPPGYSLFLSNGQFQSSLPWYVTQSQSVSGLPKFIQLVTLVAFFLLYFTQPQCSQSNLCFRFFF